MHHGIKKGAQFQIRANVSTEGYVIETLPKMLSNCESGARDPCTMEYPRDVSRLMVAVTAFFDPAVDLFECSTADEGIYWLANIGRMIGVPLTRTRRKDRQMALEGNTIHFIGTEDPTTNFPWYAKTAKRLVNATRFLCCLVRKDGNIVGDCIDCWKHCGYGCPGAAYLRSKYSLLDGSLVNKRKVKSNSRGMKAKAIARGSKHEMYISGRATVLGKRRKAPEMLKSDKDFLLSLSYPMLRETTNYLGLLCDCTENGKASQSKMISVLVEEFYDDPVAYRTKNAKEDNVLVDADQLDDLSEASFNVVEAMDSFPDDEDDGFLDKFNNDTM
ncbi:hypothetical protein SEMRO_2818_G337830.1 [Seminavis robusta]|uniref:Uncharacterized protein n=1 Tax=Seminavis robusta TaxID=568900 RepID=A0A9N8EZV4_9STRA|nr:hypothetical protein SEMRO_2818_G337830.1 [Seminavis robusta]|eukprot:Sro2818_g337830.1 n/a (330) ;mRNA; r:6612-7601